MPYEHDAPAALEEPRRRWQPPAALRWSLASAGVAAVLAFALLLIGVGDGRSFPLLLGVLLVARPLAWLLWTRRRP